MIVNLGPAAPTALVLRPSLARGNAPRTQQPLRPTASWGCYSSIIALVGDSLMENKVALKRMLPYFQFDSPLALSWKQGLLGTRDIIMKVIMNIKQRTEEAEKLTSRLMTQQQNNKADGTGRCNKTTKIINTK